MKEIIFAGVIVAMATGAVSAEGLFAGAGVSSIREEEDGDDFSTVNLTGMFGYQLTSSLAVEGEVSDVSTYGTK